MKFIKMVAVMAAGLSMAALATAETAEEANVKRLLGPKLEAGTTIDAVSKTSYSGLYEVRIGNDVVYTDAKASHLFVGRILDTANFKDMTQARLDDLNRVTFADLPLEMALKTVKGNGKRVIAVFEDPNCGYCKRFRRTVQELDNVTVYTFMYNILSEDSHVKAHNIWCASDRNKAWDDWMLNGKAAPKAPAACTSPNEQVFALGRKLNITGTPTIFFADGSRIPGAIDKKGLEKKFSSLKAGR